MWKFIVANWWLFGIGLLVIVGAIVGVVLGIKTKGRWKDRGWMKTKDGKPIRWPADAQLDIYYREDLHPDYVYELQIATAYFNAKLGRPIFVSVAEAFAGLSFDQLPPAGSSMITVFDDDGAEPDHGQTVFTNDAQGVMDRARIQLPEASIASGKARKIVRHELGHCLGLDHDERRESIMNPALQSRPQSLGESDISILRGWYGS